MQLINSVTFVSATSLYIGAAQFAMRLGLQMFKLVNVINTKSFQTWHDTLQSNLKGFMHQLLSLNSFHSRRFGTITVLTLREMNVAILALIYFTIKISGDSLRISM